MKRDLKEALKFLGKYKRTLLVITLILLGTGFLGYYEYESAVGYRETFDNLINNSFGDILENEGFGLFKAILFNNIKASVMCVVLGIIPFIMVPAFTIASNGLISGVVISSASLLSGVSPWSLIAFGILPHGIFELPALIISATLGVVLCSTVTKSIFRRPHENLSVLLDETARVYVLVVLPLLLIAAGIETYITPMLLG